MKNILNVAILATTLTGMACSANDDSAEFRSATQQFVEGVTQTFPLSMGVANQQVGTVSTYIQDGELRVTFQMWTGYTMGAAHVCMDTQEFPWTVPVECPTSTTFNPYASWWKFNIPLTEVECGMKLYVQAHVDVMSGTTKDFLGGAYAGTFKDSVVIQTECEEEEEEPEEDPKDPGCTLTQGFWKNHPDAWPVETLTIAGREYSKEELLRVFRTPPRGDASVILGHQLIAALLNQAAGADGGSATQSVSDALDWMSANADRDGMMPFGIPSRHASYGSGVALSEVLDAFNNGAFETPHCDD